MDWLREFVPPYPRKVGRRCVSPISPNDMFRPLSYATSQVTLGIGSLARSHRFYWLLFWQECLFIIQIDAVCWDPSYEYLVFLSQFAMRQHCVEGSFRLYFSVVERHICGMTVAIDDVAIDDYTHVFFCFGEYKVIPI